MNDSEKRAVVATCLMAAFADGAKAEKERDEIRRIADSLLSDADARAALAYQDALLGRLTPAAIAAEMPSRDARQVAYEMAVCVCNADGIQSEAEKRFLTELRAALQLDVIEATRFSDGAHAIVAQPLASVPPASDEQVDKLILDNAILCAALEQLPQRLATMAIVPLQMRLVYKVGAKYGFTLDKGHVVDLLSTAGVGMTAQVIDGFARRMITGLVGRFAGGLITGLSGRAASSAFAFGSTYALGHLAKRYYAGGRKLSAAQIKELFSSLVDEARGVEAHHASSIAERARSVDVGALASLVRSS